MKPKNDIPKMDDFLSTEEKMKLVISVMDNFNHRALPVPSFMELYRLKIKELETLNTVLTTDQYPLWDEQMDDPNTDETWGPTPDYRQDNEPLPF